MDQSVVDSLMGKYSCRKYIDVRRVGSLFRCFDTDPFLERELCALLPGTPLLINLIDSPLGRIPQLLSQLHDDKPVHLIIPSSSIPDSVINDVRTIAYERCLFNQAINIDTVWFLENGSQLPSRELLGKVLGGCIPLHLPTLIDTWRQLGID